MLRAMLDRFGDSVRFKGSKAQHAAYDCLLLDFAGRNFPAEVNADMAKRFGLYPSRFEMDESLINSTVWVTVDGEVVARIEQLAIPTLYANLSSV